MSRSHLCDKDAGEPQLTSLDRDHLAWVARVRYHAWRTAIPRVAWTNGTMAVPRRGVSRALWCRPRVRARGRQLLTLRSRSVGNSPSAKCPALASIIYGLTTERAALNGGARGGARMRTLVAGIGALGGTIATRAVSAGVPVRLATRTAESASLLRSSGLRVSGIGGAAVASGIQVAAREEYRGESFDLIVLACLSPVAPRATAASRRARYTPPRRVASLAEADRSRQLRGRTTDPHAALAHRLSGPLSGARGGWRRESRRRGRDRRRPQRGPAPARPPTRSASAAHARGGRGPACHAMACARGNPRGRQPFPRLPLQSSPAA